MKQATVLTLVCPLPSLKMETNNALGRKNARSSSKKQIENATTTNGEKVSPSSSLRTRPSSGQVNLARSPPLRHDLRRKHSRVCGLASGGSHHETRYQSTYSTGSSATQVPTEAKEDFAHPNVQTTQIRRVPGTKGFETQGVHLRHHSLVYI